MSMVKLQILQKCITNLSTVEINSINGTYTNMVAAEVFNGGIFNGDRGIISGTLTADTVNAQNLNVDVSLTAPVINGTTTVISQLFNGGKFNGASADIEGLITAKMKQSQLFNAKQQQV